MKRYLAAAAALLLLFLLVVPAALGAEPGISHNGRVLISTDGDVTVPAGDQVETLLVVNGTATVDGVAHTIVVIEGNAVLNGTADTLVAISSPVSLGPKSVVLNDVMKVDSLVTKTGAADVRGTIRDISTDIAGLGFVLAPFLMLLFFGFAVAAIAAGLLLAALAARQVRAAEAIISREPVQAFVTGLVGAIVPFFLVLALFITVIGAPLGLGILLGLWPAVAFVGYLVAGIWIGDWILRLGSKPQPRERPYLAATIGMIVLLVIGLWPPLSMIASLFGYGAILILAWRTFRGTPVPAEASPRAALAPSAG
jgi:hypothetical protein